MRNWAGNISYAAARLHRPASIDELRSTVAGAERIRARGTGHSFNPLIDTTGDHVTLAGLPPVIDIDRDASTVTLTGPIRYGELGVALHEAGYALHNMASLPHISVAGAVATGTHGSGNANGSLATAVAGIEMVTAGGELTHLRRGDPDFDGCVVALGALGIVTRVTLDIAPTYDVVQYVYDDLPWADFDPDIFAGGYSVSVFTDWTGPRFNLIWVKNRVSPTDRGGWSPPRHWHGAHLADGARHPIPGVLADPATPQMGSAGPWHTRLPHFRLDFTPSVGEELQTEYFIARADAMAALTAIDGMRERIAPLLAICELRTIAADDLWLSMAYRRDSLALHFTWHPNLAPVVALLPELEARLAPFDARPHWGKVFTMPANVVAGHYERLADFGRLRHAYDPTGKFGNAFVDAYAPAVAPTP
ncbi:MAG TPA: D-arabinono-1,4-lactone oxidase [Micromonosporaceae bacterium]